MKQPDFLIRLQPVIGRIDQAMRADIAQVDSPVLREVLEYAIFNGGKRIRPLLTLLAAELCGMPAGDGDACRLAMLFEYLHAASLLHDDVVDSSEVRRGRAAANLVWGNPAAILAGDFLHARAMRLAGVVGGLRCLEIVSQATNAMVEAEFLQMANAGAPNLTEDDYFRVLQGKTAALIGAACEVGAVYAQAAPEQGAALRHYGENLGLAFQVVDDLLDYWGDPQSTGKAVGNDFVEGKMTLPLIHAVRQATVDEQRLVAELLAADGNARRQRLAEVTALIEANGGLAYSRERAAGLVRDAQDELRKFAAGEAGSLLAALADYVLTRRK